MKPFIKYQDGTVEQSHLCHMFYIASLGFNIVPGIFTANGIRISYESTQEGIKMTREDGEFMVLPFRQAMHMVSRPARSEEFEGDES